MMIPTSLQTNAFLDLIDASAMVNPVPTEIAPLKIPAVDAFLSKIKQLNQAQLPVKGPALGVFYSLFLTYEEIINWSNKHFEKIPPIYGQQAIIHHKTLAFTTERILEMFGGQLPKWDTAYGSPHPDGGNKFNSTWFEDMLGIIYGTLTSNYNLIATTQSSLSSLTEYTNFINAIITASGNLFSYQKILFLTPINLFGSTGLPNDTTAYSFRLNIDTFTTEISIVGQDAQTFSALITTLNTSTVGLASWSVVGSTIVCTASVDGNLSITDNSISNPFLFLNLSNFNTLDTPVSQLQALNDLDVTNISTSYTDLVNVAPTHINTLINETTILQQQLQREYWWWSWAGGEIGYNKMTQIEQASSISLAINNEKLHTQTSQLINRIGSPALIAAKDETF